MSLISIMHAYGREVPMCFYDTYLSGQLGKALLGITYLTTLLLFHPT
jgi:hypothetical protein